MKGLLFLLGLCVLATTAIADEAAFKNLTMRYQSQVRSQLSNNKSGCTGYKVAVRKEWYRTHTKHLTSHDADRLRGSLTRRQRAEYIRAVKCLQAKPPKAPAELVPGARSRFDDFTAVHINQTLDIHFNVCVARMGSGTMRRG